MVFLGLILVLFDGFFSIYVANLSFFSSIVCCAVILIKIVRIKYIHYVEYVCVWDLTWTQIDLCSKKWISVYVIFPVRVYARKVTSILRDVIQSITSSVLWLWCNAENGKANDDSSRGESKCKNLGTCLTLSWRRPLSYRNQQCTGFYMITASVMKELSRNFNINHYWCNLCCFSSIEIITNRGLMRLNLIEL